MASPIAEAFVRLRSTSVGLAEEIKAEATKAVAQASPTILPVTPALTGPVTWEKIPGGGGVVPVPVTPTLAPGATKALGASAGKEVGQAFDAAAATALGSRSRFGGELSRVSQAAAQSVGGVGQRLSQQLAFFGPGGLAVGATVLAIGASAKAFADFETELKTFDVVAGATEDQLKEASATARALGADIRLPGVGATDAAVAMTELAKAGLSVDNSLRGTRGVLALATAAQIDFASSAEITASALNAFRLPGEDATRVADLLTGAANNAQGSIADMGLGLRQAAAVAKLAGFDINQTVTALTILAKAGIQGSDAGTSLRTTFLRLIAPTTEAQKVIDALGVSIRDANGNITPETFDRLRIALDQLTPALRQQALATVFGADAIRAASFLTEDSIDKFNDVQQKVSRAGQATEVSSARASGLAGAWENLKNQAQNLGITVGEQAAPALEGMLGLTSKLIGATDALAQKLGSIKLPDNFAPLALFSGPKAFADTAERFIGTFSDDFGKEAAQTLGKRFVDTLKDGGPEAQAAAKDWVAGIRDESDRDLKAVGSSLGNSLRTAAVPAAKDAGTKTGNAFAEAMKSSIVRNAQEAVQAAKDAVVEAQRQAGVAIEAAAVSAKQNLTQIGTELSQTALDILDQGPLAQRVAELQNQLAGNQNATQRLGLRRGLADARRELANAEAQVQTGGPSTKAQSEAVDDFLRPFRRKVDDAKAALSEFNTQGVINKLQDTLTRQKNAITRGIGDVVAAFNAGSINADQANNRIARVLGSAQAAYRSAGSKLGIATRQGFLAELAGLRQQISEIIRGPQTKKTGAEPNIVSPSGVAAEQARNVADAQQRVLDAQADLKRAIAQATEAAKKNSDKEVTSVDKLIAAINANTTARGGTPPKTKPTGQTSQTGSGRR